MGRRIVAFLLAFSLILGGCSGGEKEVEHMKHPIRFFYRASNDQYGTADSAAAFEYFDAAGHEEDPQWILRTYFSGPQKDGLIAPFPKATTLVSAKMEDRCMTVMLSEEFSQLSGMALTIACSCITLTCLEFPGVLSVEIRSLGGSMGDTNAVIMSKDSLLLRDQSQEMTGSRYTLYFSDINNRYLIAENFELDEKDEDLATALLNGLIAGPKSSGLAHTVPPETKVMNLAVDNGICSINLSREFVEQAPKTELAQRMTILSITNTLTQLSQITGVILYSEGERLSHFGDMDLSGMLTYEADAIGPARTSLNENDETLYLCIGSNELLSPVPVRVQQSADKIEAELLLETLIKYAGRNGYVNPIPADTKILRASLEEDVCVVELSKEFIQKPDDMRRALRSISATIIGTEAYSSVRISVEGMRGSDVQDIMGSFRPDPSWFAEN